MDGKKSKAIEINRLSSWNTTALDEPNIIEPCRGRNLALVASSNQVAVFNYLQNKVDQSLSIPCGDTICSASFHPSGNHIIMCFKDKLQLANVLVDGIVPFWETLELEPCIDCKFNQRGNIFAVICGKSIIVYDFITGREICTIDCNGTNFTKLKWGVNCTIHAVCEEGLHICKWDSLSGSKLAEYRSANKNILAYTVTADSKTLFTSSNSIVYLNRDLKHDSTIQIGEDEEYILNGTICVSNEGLVFVGMNQRDDMLTTIVRIYSAVGGDHFDQPIEDKVKVIQISADGRYLITNKTFFQIQDRRGYNQYLTSCLDLSISEDFGAIDNQTEVLLSKSHVESKDSLLRDLKSRLTEVDVLNDLELRSVRQGHIDELRRLRGSYEEKISGLGKQRGQILHEKMSLIQCNQLDTKNAMSANLSEIHQLEEKYKVDILNEVAKSEKVVQNQRREALRMEEERGELLKKHEKELTELALNADQRFAKQREITSRLETQHLDLERQSKETIALLEDEIDDSISLMVTKFEKEIKDERDTHERFALENGILLRRIASTQETIVGVKDRVASLLHKEEEYQMIARKREEERERLDAIRDSKGIEQTSKNDAVSRLKRINRQQQKTRDIENDKLQEVKDITRRGPLIEKVNKISQELISTASGLELAGRTNVSMKKKNVELQKSAMAENNKVEILESKIRNYNSTIDGYLVKLEECNTAIQNPDKLRNIFFSMQNSFTARSPDKQTPPNRPNDSDNQATFLFLAKTNELDRLKAEDSRLTEKFKEEKAKQITVNTSLLNRELINTSGSRRRSISIIKRTS